MTLELDENNSNTLSNRGYTYNLFENYQQAIIDFDKVLEIDPESAYAYSNRGYAKIKMNLLEEGLPDIKKAISINARDSYAYRNLGLYYLETGDYREAMEQLNIAQRLDPDKHMINEYIGIVEEKLTGN